MTSNAWSYFQTSTVKRIFQALTALLSDDSKFGFIVMDGNGALFGTLSGNTREVLHKFTVDLPKKHGNDIASLALVLPGWMVPDNITAVSVRKMCLKQLFTLY